MNKWFESAIVFATLAGFFIVATGFGFTFSSLPLNIFGFNSLLFGEVFVQIATIFCVCGFSEEWYKEMKKGNGGLKKFLEFLFFFVIAVLFPIIFLFIFGKTIP
jgi:hypothetical protein